MNDALRLLHTWIAAEEFNVMWSNATHRVWPQFGTARSLGFRCWHKVAGTISRRRFLHHLFVCVQPRCPLLLWWCSLCIACTARSHTVLVHFFCTIITHCILGYQLQLANLQLPTTVAGLWLSAKFSRIILLSFLSASLYVSKRGAY